MVIRIYRISTAEDGVVKYHLVIDDVHTGFFEADALLDEIMERCTLFCNGGSLNF